MKNLLILAILTVAVFSFSGCATSDTATTKGDPVPGETKSAEEGRMQPGAGTTGPNASVKW